MENNTRGKSRRKPKDKSGRPQIAHAKLQLVQQSKLFVRRLILSVVILMLVGLAALFLFWQRSALISLATDIGGEILRLFGWGLLLILIAIVTLSGMLWRRKLFSLFRHGNKWLGSTALALAAWGTLALFPGEGVLRQVSLGGRFGLGIIDHPAPDFIGLLRILGLVIIGILLLMNHPCLMMSYMI